MEIVQDCITLCKLFINGMKPHHKTAVIDVKKHYENEHYDWITDPKFPEKMLHDKRKAAMYIKSRTYTSHGESVLDIGCGTGLITQVLPGNVTGLDISQWKLDRAKIHVPTATFIQGDAEKLPFTENTFDVVCCTDCLEHLERPELVVEGAYRILKPRGYFIGTVPSKHIIWKMRRFLTNSDYGVEPFHNYYLPKQLRKMLNTFKIAEISYQCLGLELFFAVRK